MAPLVIPDPSLVLLVGAAGSGKSTLAARLFAPDEIVSSDALRAVVSGDEADQRATAVAFRILHRTLARRLPTGLLTVVDATNALAAHRRPLIRRAQALGMPIVAIVLDLPADVVHAQNTSRARVVDPGVVDRHIASIRALVDGPGLAVEGVDPVVVLRGPAEAAALTIARRATSPSIG
jgi:protein phosphatase